MDVPEPPPPPQSESKARPISLPGVSVEELEQQCQDLRTLLHATLVALVVLTLGVTLFLAKQMRSMRYEVTEMRRLMQRLDQEFKVKEPKMKSFVSVLQAYTLTNQDFAPILNRYRSALPQYFMSPVSVTTMPAPVPAPALTNAPK
jgi:NifB/MoaA-like Fe-S oxidoreductase